MHCVQNVQLRFTWSARCALIAAEEHTVLLGSAVMEASGATRLTSHARTYPAYRSSGLVESREVSVLVALGCLRVGGQRDSSRNLQLWIVSLVMPSSHMSERTRAKSTGCKGSLWMLASGCGVTLLTCGPGEDWCVKIREAITGDTLVFIACFSRRSVARRKSYQNEEILLAVGQLRLRKPDDPWLIPVRFDDCEIPDYELGAGRTLASIQRVDLFGDGRDLAAKRLVATVLRILGQPPPPTTPKRPLRKRERKERAIAAIREA